MSWTLDGFPAAIVPTPPHITERIFEREFLIRLAPIWLAARWNVMNKCHAQENPKHRHAAMAFDALGAKDYAAEMRLMCQEARTK